MIWSTSRPIMIVLNRRFRFFGFERDWRLQRGIWCFSIVDLSFALPMSLRKFSRFHFTLPFFGFSPWSRIFFSFSLFFFNYPIMYSKIQNSSRMGEWFIKMILAETETSALLTMKNSPRKISSVYVSTFDQNGLFRYVMYAIVYSFERKDI